MLLVQMIISHWLQLGEPV